MGEPLPGSIRLPSKVVQLDNLKTKHQIRTCKQAVGWRLFVQNLKLQGYKSIMLTL